MKRWWAGSACVALVVVAAVWVPAASAASRPQTHTQPLIVSRPLTHTHPLLGIQTNSYDWCGYDDSIDGPFTSVTATWTQPRVRASGATFTDAAFWVGLDGDNSDTVEQIGTEGYSEGVVGYDAWFEMYPAYPVTIDMSIHPGDVLTGTVTESGAATFTLSLVDHTSGKSFEAAQTMSVPPAVTSAEVIAEAPSSSSGVVALSDFGLVQFSACAFNGQPIGDFDWNRIGMLSWYDDAPVANAGPLGSDGASFIATSDLTAPHTQVTGAGASWHGRPVTLRFTAADDRGGTGVAYTEYSLDGGTTWTQGTSVVVPAPSDHSADGANEVLYRSADKAGNLETDESCIVRIDTRQPTPVASHAASAARGRTAQVRYEVTDPRPGSPTATVTITIRNARGALAKRVVLRHRRVDRELAYDFVCKLAKGRYRFTVSATDAAGNTQTAVASNTLVVH